MRKIILILFFTVVSNWLIAQNDTIKIERDTTSTTRGDINTNRSSGNYFNLHLPGIELEGADFTPLDDTITKLNNAGWDVKIIGYYGLSSDMSQEAYDQLIEGLIRDKQIIVFLKNYENKIQFVVEINDSKNNNALKNIIKEEIESELNANLTTFVANQIIENLARSLIFVLNSSAGNIITPPNFSGRNSDLEKIPFYISKGEYFLAPSNIPFFLPHGTRVWFFDDFWSCLDKDGYGKGMLFAFYQDNKYFKGMGTIDQDGDLYFDGYYANYSNPDKRTIFKPYLHVNTRGTPLDLVACYSSPCGLVKKDLKILAGEEDLSGFAKGKCLTLDNAFLFFQEIKTSALNISEEINVNHSISQNWVPFTRELYDKNDCPENFDFIKSKNYLSWQKTNNSADAVIIEYNNQLLILYTAEGIIFYSQETNNAYFYEYASKSFKLIDTPEQAKLRWKYAIGKKIATETLRAAIIIVPAILTGGAATVLQITLAEAACIGALYIVNKDKEELVVNTLFLGVGFGLGKYVENTIEAADDYVRNQSITKHLDATTKEILDARKITAAPKMKVCVKIDDKIELIDLKVYEEALSLDKKIIFHSDIKKLLDEKKFDVIEKFSIGKYINGKLEFQSIKAWESALTKGVDDIIRRKPEFLEMLSKFPYGTGKQTLIDNATADEWTQIFSGSLKKANNPDPNAAALVAEYGGESGVIFKTDPSGKEFDLISPTLIGEHKVLNTTTAINSGDRHSYRMQFIACQKQSKSGLWVFEGVQNDSHINKVIEYANEYQINTVIKLNGTIIHNLTF